MFHWYNIFNSGKSSKLLKAAAALYYILLLVPVVLLILWVVIIGVNVGPNPALPILFIGISVFLILIPSQSKLFYLKTMGIFISYVTAELLILGLNFDAS
jgi:hypothetical protein